MRSWRRADTVTVCPMSWDSRTNLLTVKLDVTQGGDAEAAVAIRGRALGRIDVLVNNAASFYAGFFEELTPQQIERQLATSLVGPINVTRAVLPVMRKQRSGHIISISSSGGLTAGFDFVSAYAASKFGLEGWMESLTGRSGAVRDPYHHRQSGIFPDRALDRAVDRLRRAVDRGLRRAPCGAARVLEIAEWQAIWRPGKLARALITIVSQEPPPRRFIAGADAIAIAEQKVADLKAQIDADRNLSTSLAFD